MKPLYDGLFVSLKINLDQDWPVFFWIPLHLQLQKSSPINSQFFTL